MKHPAGIPFFGQWRAAAFALAVAALTASGALAQTEGGALIYQKDGRGFEAQIVATATDSVEYRLPGVPSIQRQTYDQIDYIDFPKPEYWAATMTAFEQGRFTEAAEVFKKVSLQKDSSTGYPAPGNLATLAERRLIDCYRRLRNAEEIGYLFKRIEWDKLPRLDRDGQEIVRCWALAGDEEWEEARAAVVAASEKLADTDPASAELEYILAVVESNRIGDEAPETEAEIEAVVEAEEEAVVHFGRAFSIDAAADPGMAADALRQSIEHLIGKEEREEELKALVHMYAELHGNGQLWADAGDRLNQLHAEGLEIAAIARKPEADQIKPPAGGPIRARYIRIERVAEEPTFVSLTEIEVISADNNIAPLGKASQSSVGKIGNQNTGAKLAIDGKSSASFQARTTARTGEEAKPWWEIDLGEMKQVDELILFNSRNNQDAFINPPGAFRISLLDGSRQEVFAREDLRSPEPRTALKIRSGDDAGGAEAPSKTESEPKPAEDGKGKGKAKGKGKSAGKPK